MSCRSPAFWEGPAWLELGATEWLGSPVSTRAGAAAERPSPGTCNHCQETTQFHGGGREACGTPDPPGSADKRLHGPRMREGAVTRTQSNVSWLPSRRRCPGWARAPCCPWVPSAQPRACSSTWAPSAGHAAEDTAPPGGQPHRQRGPAPSPPLRAQLPLGWRAGSPTRSLWGSSVSRTPGTGPPRHSSPELSPPGLGRQRGGLREGGEGEGRGLHLAQKDQQPPASVSPSEPPVCRTQEAGSAREQQGPDGALEPVSSAPSWGPSGGRSSRKQPPAHRGSRVGPQAGHGGPAPPSVARGGRRWGPAGLVKQAQRLLPEGRVYKLNSPTYRHTFAERR